MNKITFSLEDMFGGILGYLKNHEPKLVERYDARLLMEDLLDKPENCALASFKFTVRGSENTVKFKCLFPDEKGVYYLNGRKYSSPYVLVRKPFVEELHELDLEQLYVIPGYFLFVALEVLEALRELSRNENEVDKIVDVLESRLNTVQPGIKYLKLKPKEKGKTNRGKNLEEQEFIWLKVPVLFDLHETNELLAISDLRKVVYPGDRVPESLRLPHSSHRGRLDPLETPESENIGLCLFMSSGAKYNALELKIEASGESLVNLLSPATRMVPFIMYSDGVRVTMGGKNLKQGIKVVESEPPLIKTSICDELDMNIGVNALVGYVLYKGLNFEDGIVCSESFTRRMRVEETRVMTFSDFIPIPPDATVELSNKSKIIVKSKKLRVVYEFRRALTEVKKNDWIFKRSIELRKDNSWRKIKGSYKVECYDSLYDGVIEQNPCAEQLKIKMRKYQKVETKEHRIKPSGMVEIKIKILVNKPLEVGDKITGRHGNKGTISMILPDNEMPSVEIDGQQRALDLLLSPFGVITRMNLGQLIETEISLSGEYVDDPFKPVDISSNSKRKLRFPDGRAFEANVGYQYFVRLDHCVRDKLHVVRNAETSFITGQPVKGRRRNGGQRIGEMEFWTLFDHNAINVVKRLSLTNTDEIKEYKDYYFWTFNELVKRFMSHETEVKEEPLAISFSKIRNKEDKRKDSQEQTIKEKQRKKFLNTISRGTTKKLEKKYLLTKNGYLRKYMLGRRIHNSGRATITPVTDIDIDHVYLPLEMAIEWFGIEPSKNLKTLVREATSKVEKEGIMVLLNRQPSLHKHSISSARPLFWEHRTIGLPIMICEGFGADFDGDTMAVYLPVNQDKATKEELKKMLPSNSPYRIGNGEIVYSIDQDLVLGEYVKSGLKKSQIKDKVREEIIQKSENLRLDLLKWQKETLEEASRSDLSISFQELARNTGNADLIRRSGSRGKEQHFKQMSEKIEFSDGKTAPPFSEGVPEETYLGGSKTEDLRGTIVLRSRAGLIDKKLHVAQAGYFTRKLVELLYPIRIAENDCGINSGLKLSREDFDFFTRRKVKPERFLLGRYVKRTEDREWSLVTYENLESFIDCDLFVRSPVFCQSETGPCSKCCGLELSRMSDYSTGDFVGVIAGHTIGERGTQLSMKTFQTGSSGFNMQKVSSEFFWRETNDYLEYIKRLARRSVEGIIGEEKRKKYSEYKEEEGTPLFSSIDVSSIYFEILFSQLRKLILTKESEVKRYLTNLERGFFSALSFEREAGQKIDLTGRVLPEISPKAHYALLPGEVKL